MLQTPLSFNGIDAGFLFDYLYSFFHRDFINTPTYLDTVYIDPQSYRKIDGKEASFWHLTSRKQTWTTKDGNRWKTFTERLPDYARSERIEWVRKILTNHTSDQIKIFYHQETNKTKDIRLYLWAYKYSFVVILQKLGRSKSFLVTSFYVDHKEKEKEYEMRCQIYKSKRNPNLIGCEWF